MRIALLKSRFASRGGLEKYTLRLANAFVQHGCDVTLLTTDPISIKDVKCVCVAKPAKSSLIQLVRFNRAYQKWLERHPQDVVFGLERTVCQTHYRAGNGVHKVYLQRRALTDSLLKRLSFSINPLHRTLLRYEKKAFEDPRLEILFTNSQMVKEEIRTHYRTEPQKIHVVHNGVEWKEFAEATLADKMEARKKVGLNPTAFQFLFIGNGYQRKGLSFLFQGLAALREHDFQLAIVGKEKKIKTFVQMAKKLKLEKKVVFFGSQPSVASFYQAADALVLPSIYDPFANVTVEALAMGLFVVTSRFNGAHEILSPRTGVVIEDLTSAESLKKALTQAIAHPKTPSSAFEIRQSVKHLDFSSQLDKIVDLTLKSMNFND